MKVFLGGAVESTWRDQLIPLLKIDYFNPVVDVWNYEAMEEAYRQKAESDFNLYVFTPKMIGVYAIGELVQDSIKKPAKTVFCVLDRDGAAIWDDSQTESLKAVAELVKNNGAKVFDSLEAVADYLNSFYAEAAVNPNLIECLIEREGNTEIIKDTTKYVFKKNEEGHSVCEVLRLDHRKAFLQIPDFRIYKEDQLPKPEFDPNETEWLRQIRVMNAESLRAWVNGRLNELNDSSLRFKQILNEKWKSIIPIQKQRDPKTRKVTTYPQQPCPVQLPEGSKIEPQGVPGGDDFPIPDDLYDQVSDVEFVAKWKFLTSEKYKPFVVKYLQRFLNMEDDAEYDKAEAKWKKMFPDEVWPIDNVED